MKNLFNYEKETAEIISQRSRILLFDAMGMGKTITLLSGINKISHKTEKPLKCIICTPNTLLGQWSECISEWTESFETITITGDKTQREQQYKYFNDVKTNIFLLTNYNLLVRDTFYKNAPVDILVLDEGYLIRNSSSKTYQFLYDYIPNIERVYILSGNADSFTNLQFYNIADLLFRGKVQKGSKEQIQYDLGDCFVSRSFSDITEIPINKTEPVIIPIPLDITDEQKMLLGNTAIEENRARKLGKPTRIYYQKKLFIINSPRIINMSYGFSPKENLMTEKLKNLPGKIVLYCKNKKYIKVLKNDLQALDIRYAVVSGEMPIYLRDRNLDIFKNDSVVKCLILSSVGKYGLNLQVANNLICMSVPNSLFELNQLIGRLYRVNQMEEVVCYIPYYKETEEEKLIANISRV